MRMERLRRSTDLHNYSLYFILGFSEINRQIVSERMNLNSEETCIAT